jgi:calcium permeable stress-gated cation channel
VFRTSNSDFIHKSGLDAYFFLRYLRTLLKIFIPLALLILPILIPINYVGGLGEAGNVKGLDQLSWTNVNTRTHVNRYWAHLALAVIVICYVCYIFYDELRGYIRLRQAYLTSPQHRLRASATTVLVTAIPRKWLTIDALDQLYDVYPGGLRNIWINRDFDELSEKVKKRNELALKLEAAETDLIKKAVKAYKKKEERSGKKMTKAEKMGADAQAEEMASGPGVSSGDPHQIRHSVREALSDSPTPPPEGQKRPRIPVPIVGQGLEVVGGGIDKLGHTVVGGFKKVGKGVNERLNTTGGFLPDDGTSQIGNRPDPNSENRGPTRAVPYQSNVGSRADNAKERVPKIDTETTEAAEGKGGSGLAFWRKNGKKSAGEDAEKKAKRKRREDDELPLSYPSPVTPGANPQATVNGSNGVLRKKRKSILPWGNSAKEDRQGEGQEEGEFPVAFNERYEEDDYGEPMWKKYLSDSDRETMRLPIFGWAWMPSLPLLGKKVDTIYYCRKEVARLNVEIEQGQQDPERYPLMNSAFVQFNHQVAAHMACQSVSHHIPQHMTPRHVEVSPDDVIWENMSIRWWERYIRTALVIVVVSGLVVGWAFPVTFTGLVSQISYLTTVFPWLNWIKKLPGWLLGVISGVLPQLMLAILMAVLPMILRLLAKQQGVHTGMAMELSVQNYYFAFLFVQVFLVVSLSSGITTVIQQISKDVTSTPRVLAKNLPKAGNYFFSYLLLQAFSVSAGALVQIGGLISWFILSPLLDSTARQKWTRQTSLPKVQWGTFFPVFTNLACIGAYSLCLL